MKILPELDHPEIQGPPLERGVRYGHHFVVELISDGRRLWAVASDEGRKILHQIAHGLTGDEPVPEPEVGPTVGEWVAAGYSAKVYPPSPYASRSTPEEIMAAIDTANDIAAKAVANQSGTGTEPVTNQSAQSLDPDGKPATGDVGPQPIGAAAPTTTTGPANSFD